MNDLLEILRTAGPSLELVEDAVARTVEAITARDPGAIARARERMGAILAAARAPADLAGRVTLRLELKGPRPDKFAAEIPTRVIPVEFADAVKALAERDPQLATSIGAAARSVRELYAPITDPKTGRRHYPAVFALTHAAELAIVAQVQDVIVIAIASGQATPDTAAVVAALGDWPKSYAATVVRTNVASAFSAGRQREARVLREDTGLEVGFTFQTAGDADVRAGRKRDHGENHRALDGIAATEDDPVWDFFTPPLGFNCRCTLVPSIAGEWTPHALSTARARGARAAIGFGARHG